MKTGPPSRPRTALTAVVIAFVLAGLAWAFNPGPRWRVAATQQADGNVLFDDDPVPATDVEAIGDLLIEGATIEWRGFGDLEFVSPGQAVIALAPGTVVTLPAPPPRWFARTSRARLHEGTLRFLAGPGFRGARLVVETPARTVVATSRDSALAVTHDAAGGTRVETRGPGIESFARTRKAQLGAHEATAPPQRP